MFFAGEGLFLVELILLVYCVLNIVTTPEAEIRNLPKLVWLLLVVVLPLAGGIAWLVGGRPVGASRAGVAHRGARGVPAEYDRPGRAVAQSPDDDETFLSGLRARVDAQRAEAERRRTELEDEASARRAREDGADPA